MSESARWAERYAATDMVWGLQPNPFVVETCSGYKPGRALDLGAGEGRNSLWLATRGWTVTAVDFVDLAIARLNGRAAAEGLAVTALVADVLSYRPKPGSFDLVLLCYLQLPSTQRRRVLASAAEALAPGGRLLLIAHDAANIVSGYGGPRNPDLLTTADRVASALTELGLTVTRAERREREVAVDIGFRYALDHVVEAVRPSS